MAHTLATRPTVALRPCAARRFVRPVASSHRQEVESSCFRAPADRILQLVPKAGELLAATVLAFTVVTAGPVAASDVPTPTEQAAPAAPAKKIPQTVYFGNGCFWGRQKDFVDTERALNKPISAVVGYAGGLKEGPDGRVCYYYSDPRTVYERLGHAEVVKVDLGDEYSESSSNEFRRFAQTYFSEFVQTPFGMRRLDPQDAGPSYRNVVGLPGGTKSPFFKVLQEENVNNMDLREGQGNEFRSFLGGPSEDDLLNVVWVVDSNKLPFYQAEVYHQFHNGIGKAFPREYTQDLKNKFMSEGRITQTGCPELPF